MDFDGADILALAEQAAELGMDMLVLDDGWFGKRDDDTSGLGDWYVNEEKLGGKMKELIYWVHRRGLKFGLWIEPEMINEDSDLYREHPDWAMAIPGRKPVRGRSQLVLDFSRKEVVDHVFESICKVLDEDVVDYVKWDYNRSIADVYSCTASDQGRVLYDYILGLYDFLERLSQRYPDMLIEGCSGGGGRFDAGMLYYTPQIWCSDNTDPIDRLRIQYGTSFGYPASCVGAHVSVSPNEQDGRVTPLNTRGITAMSGTFGYELNPEKLSAQEKDEIRAQVAKRKEVAELIHNGKYYRLTSPFDGEAAAWEFVSEDGTDVLLNVVNLEIHGNRPVTYIRLQGLSSGAAYRDEESGRVYPADALMEAGLPMPAPFGEYGALQIRFKMV
jgi:alpha-galactosidase